MRRALKLSLVPMLMFVVGYELKLDPGTLLGYHIPPQSIYTFLFLLLVPIFLSLLIQEEGKKSGMEGWSFDKYYRRTLGAAFYTFCVGLIVGSVSFFLKFYVNVDFPVNEILSTSSCLNGFIFGRLFFDLYYLELLSIISINSFFKSCTISSAVGIGASIYMDPVILSIISTISFVLTVLLSEIFSGSRNIKLLLEKTGDWFVE